MESEENRCAAGGFSSFRNEGKKRELYHATGVWAHRGSVGVARGDSTNLGRGLLMASIGTWCA